METRAWRATSRIVTRGTGLLGRVERWVREGAPQSQPECNRLLLTCPASRALGSAPR
ncbi:protein of unknown function [Blastococcus saxobsidens DD2]|uniref:Uncharacterized protein n=1 Tax=Blastococcus saxobsidens (strain DD2) TaxID=1146883 RepID=H6RV59_BLASD|nr:protein of unknown function [Blastococcus saxobsidens DD2]